MLILLLIAFVAVFADVLAPYDPQIGTLSLRYRPPAWQEGGSVAHLLGTDQVGRDVLSRLIFGARVSMIVGITAVLFAGAVGTFLGIVSGYLGGWADQVVMRVTDAWLALPALTFAIFLAAIVGPSELNIVVILGLVYWTRYARVIRGEVLSLKQREFVRLAIVAGCPKHVIMWRHILPNVINSAVVLGTLMLGVVIVTEAALSFLGVGVPPPKPAWGLMMADGKQGLMVGHWWLAVLPGTLHHAHGAVGQSARRLAAREARPATASAVTVAMSSKPLLSLENLSAHYVSQQGTRVVRAVDDVTLSLDAGKTLGIVGESGSGKSTLALTIMRLLPPAARIVSGRMMFEGENLLDKSDAEMRHVRGKRIAMILQDPMASLNPLFSIGNQVGEPIRVHEGASSANAWQRAVRLLKSVRIASPETRVAQFPHEMSGGMRQRIVGAIGISCEPRLLIADEPTTSLDLTIQAQYLGLLRDLQREHGLALIFITHNLGIVAKMCDQLAVMYAGRIVEQGPVSQIFSAPVHPYTRALLGSIPRMTDGRERLTAIDGQPPDLASLSPGCAFAPRCTAAVARCRLEAPPEVSVDTGRSARCWLAAPSVGAESAMMRSSVA